MPYVRASPSAPPDHPEDGTCRKAPAEPGADGAGHGQGDRRGGCAGLFWRSELTVLTSLDDPAGTLGAGHEASLAGPALAVVGVSTHRR
jgi:hypothetical protein